MPAVRLLGALHFLALDEVAPQLAAHLPSCGGDGGCRCGMVRGKRVVRAARAGAERALRRYAANQRGRALDGAPRRRLRDLHAVPGCRCGCSTWVRARGSTGASTGIAMKATVGRGAIRRRRWCCATARAAGTPALGDAPILERLGCDVHPLDIGSARDRLRLLSFVWADQLDRVERLQAAFAAARHTPMRIDRADMFLWIAQTRETAPRVDQRGHAFGRRGSSFGVRAPAVGEHDRHHRRIRKRRRAVCVVAVRNG